VETPRRQVKALLFERDRAVADAVPVAARARLDLRGEAFATRPLDLARQGAEEDARGVYERAGPLSERCPPLSRRWLRR